MNPLERFVAQKKLESAGVILERIKFFKHQAPANSTLERIINSGLLRTLQEIKAETPEAIVEVTVRPILPMTARWEITANPWDRLFIVIKPDKFGFVVSKLDQSGFRLNRETKVEFDEPYFFDNKTGDQFVKGVMNPDAYIIKSDFPRPEKLFK